MGGAVTPGRAPEAESVANEAQNVDGRTMAEIAEAADETFGQRVVRKIDDPVKESSGIRVLWAIWRPTGAS